MVFLREYGGSRRQIPDTMRIDTLISLPPRLSDFLNEPGRKEYWLSRLSADPAHPAFLGSDPAARRLGSGGGTVHLLDRCAENMYPGSGYVDFLDASRKLILHAGGESRRLPAYAAIGKALLPLPPLPEIPGERFDRLLADCQLPGYAEALRSAGPHPAALVTSGDVWIDFDPLEIPRVTADIVGIGLRVPAETASHFGVFFVRRDRTHLPARECPIAFFRQKPSPAEIHRLHRQYDFWVDTGMWFLSAAALLFLKRACGWDEKRDSFGTEDGLPAPLDLYGEVGPCLGEGAEPAPAAWRSLGWNNLTSHVIPLENARFHHLGSNRQLFESLGAMDRQAGASRQIYHLHTPRDLLLAGRATSVWVEACQAPAVEVGGQNLLTGLPLGHRVRRLQPWQCLDVLPALGGGYIVRPYHLDDSHRGILPGNGTIAGHPARAWLEARPQLTWESGMDVFDVALHPIVPRASDITQDLVDWFFDPSPSGIDPRQTEDWPLLSSRAIPSSVDFSRYWQQRELSTEGSLREAVSTTIAGQTPHWLEGDLEAMAGFCRRRPRDLRRWLEENRGPLLDCLPDPSWLAKVHLLYGNIKGVSARNTAMSKGFSILREAILADDPPSLRIPKREVKEDQIIWARSPVRLDLAGGWTDTPPYCFAKGGSVLNLAVTLNGQPPIQVFVRALREPEFRLHSIDLGISEVIRSYDDLATFRDPRAGFSLPKAALVLAGFLPARISPSYRPTLRKLVDESGGGLEITLLCAVPKGSGLGTSSILAATILGALNRACGLGWDVFDLYRRVLTMEQLLTTGGGWQDQAGALFPGAKLIETQPGLSQHPVVRQLPEGILEEAIHSGRVLLYYTGLTRLAKDILKEIVADMFLGRGDTMQTLSLIRSNAYHLYQSWQRNDWEEMVHAVNRSWIFNCRLDAGTSTPAIDQLLDSLGEDLVSAKLLGAGGGGYLFMVARSPEAGRRIRAKLEAHPPNQRARFVEFALSRSGLTVTGS